MIKKGGIIYASDDKINYSDYRFFCTDNLRSFPEKEKEAYYKSDLYSYFYIRYDPVCKKIHNV